MAFQYHALPDPAASQRLADAQSEANTTSQPNPQFDQNPESEESLLSRTSSIASSPRRAAADSHIRPGRKQAPVVSQSEIPRDPLNPSPKPLRTTLASWLLEVGAMLLSVGSLVAIIAVLYRENDKPIDRWSLAISLNTVVSTLGTLARTTLAFALSACVGQQRWSWLHKRSGGLIAFERFDGAVRGPWGGTRLFIWLRARHWAALGALVIMGTVAFDPFLQAVISNQGRLDDVDSDSSTAISHIRRVSAGVFTVLNSSGVISSITSAGQRQYMPVRSRPDFGVLGSIYNGFRNNSMTQEDLASFTCISGNCTWPVFASAAVCSSCVDVSKHLTSETEFGQHGTSIPSESNLVMLANFTSWRVPNAEIKNFDGRSASSIGGTQRSTLMTLNTTANAEETIAFRDAETLLMAFKVLRTSEGYMSGTSNWEDSKPSATECAWYLCANAYRATSVNNELKEEVVGSWSTKKPSSYGPKIDYDDYNSTKGMELAKAAIVDLGPTLYDFSVIREDLQVEIPSDAAEGLGVQDRVFNFSQAFAYSTISYLDQITHKPGEWDSFNYTTRKYIPGSDVVGYPAPDQNMPSIADAIWNSANLSITFENVARSITLQLRNNSPDKLAGTMHQWVIHVQANWWYLTFPIAMLSIGLVYVMLVIIESTRLRIPVWKESARPTLLYGLNDETQRLLREEIQSKQMVTSMRYRMDEKEDCLRLMADQKS